LPSGSAADDLRDALGDPTLDPELLQLALTHRSYAYENGNLPTNERLEFLGDSVLGVVITETLYVTNPDLSEGRLAKLRAAVVNARAFEVPAKPGIRFHDMVTVSLGGTGTISHVINNTGAAVNSGHQVTNLVSGP